MTESRRSSAYNDTLCSTPKRTMLFKTGVDLRAIDSGSTARAKSKGDKGHPWHVPLDRAK